MEALTSLPRPILYTMYAFQIPASVSTASVALERFESAIYRAAAVFQAQVVPRVYHAVIVVAHLFIQAAIATYVSGVRCGRWYRIWFAVSTIAAIPAIETAIVVDPQPLLVAAPGALLALPPVASFHPAIAAVETRQLRQEIKRHLLGAEIFGTQALVPPAPKAKTAPKNSLKPKPPAGIAADVFRGKLPPETLLPRKAPTTARSAKGVLIAID
jgi:hypothetical protein